MKYQPQSAIKQATTDKKKSAAGGSCPSAASAPAITSVGTAGTGRPICSTNTLKKTMVRPYWPMVDNSCCVKASAFFERTFHIRQKRGDSPEQRQERAHAVHEFDAVQVGQAPEDGRADASHSESEAEEQSGHRADFARHEFLSEHEDGRERGRQYQSDDETQDPGPQQIDIREQHREGGDAQNGEPDDALAAHAIADRAAEERAERGGEEEIEQVQLGRLHRQMKFFDEVETVITRDACQIEILREDQGQQDGNGPRDATRRNGNCGNRPGLCSNRSVYMSAPVPRAHVP